MKLVIASVMTAMLAVAGCTSTSEGGGETTEAAIAERAGMVGTWAGSLDSGASVRVTVPASGKISYAFKGQRVPISGTRDSGGTLVSTLTNGGTVRLSMDGEGLAFRYAYGGQTASTVLTRS